MATQVLPLAFIGMHDPSTVVQKVWKEVWTSNTGGDEGGIRLYLAELMVLIVPTFDHRSWDIKKQGALALAAIADNAYKGSLDTHADQLLDTVCEALKGRTFDGKETLVQCLVAVAVACRAYITADPEKMKRVVAALLHEAAKPKREYKLAVLAHVSTFLKGCEEDCDELDAIVKIVIPAVTPEEDEEEQAESDDEERRKMAARNEKLLIAGFDTLGKAVAASPGSGVAASSVEVWGMVAKAATACTWKVSVPVLEAVTTLLKRDSAVAADAARRSTHFAAVVPAALLAAASKHAAPRKVAAGLLLTLFKIISEDAGLQADFAAGKFSDGNTAGEVAGVVASLCEDADPVVRVDAAATLAVIKDKLGVSDVVVAPKAAGSVGMDSTPD